MPENSSDPTYLEKKFNEAKSRYRQIGVEGILIETDKDKDLEPKGDKDFKDAQKRFTKSKSNVVTMGSNKHSKSSPESSVKIFGIHKPSEGEK